MAEGITRRDFVRAGVLAGGALVLDGVSGCAPSASGDKAEVATPTTSYGEDAEMSKRILVGYATRTGSTVGVAEAIGATLAERGFSVDVRPLKERPSLAGYDACVLGSAINGGAWLPEAMRYLEANRATLETLPTAVYCVHIMNAGDGEKARRKRNAYLGKVRDLVTPVDEGFFLGKGPTAEETSLIARWAFKAFGGAGAGDCRDWEKIRGWAQRARV